MFPKPILLRKTTRIVCFSNFNWLLIACYHFVKWTTPNLTKWTGPFDPETRSIWPSCTVKWILNFPFNVLMIIGHCSYFVILGIYMVSNRKRKTYRQSWEPRSMEAAINAMRGGPWDRRKRPRRLGSREQRLYEGWYTYIIICTFTCILYDIFLHKPKRVLHNLRHY